MYLSKINKIKNSENLLFAYWANNRGRGDSNCTLQLVPSGTERKNFSRDNKNVISEIKTSSWHSDVNVSHEKCEYLGIKKNQIIV